MDHDSLAVLAEAAAATSPDAVGGLWTLTSLAALLTLTALEIVLGIDNIVFIAIISQKLPAAQQARARHIGLLLAMGMRIVLLLGIYWVLRLTTPLFDVPFIEQTVTDPETGEAATQPLGISGKDLVLLFGGLFLIAKSVWEIRHQMHPEQHGTASTAARKAATFGGVILQIVLLDLVFSLDSVITAAGMTKHIPVMITAVVIAVGVMLIFAGPVARFVERHPTMKILALSFLILIGVLLTAEGLHQHFDRGYVYFAMAFALGVDLLQMKQGGDRLADHGDHD